MIRGHHLRPGDVIIISLSKTMSSSAAKLYGFILERHFPDMGDEDIIDVLWSDGVHCWKAPSSEDKVLEKCDLVATARE